MAIFNRKNKWRRKADRKTIKDFGINTIEDIAKSH